MDGGMAAFNYSTFSRFNLKLKPNPVRHLATSGSSSTVAWASSLGAPLWAASGVAAFGGCLAFVLAGCGIGCFAFEGF